MTSNQQKTTGGSGRCAGRARPGEVPRVAVIERRGHGIVITPPTCAAALAPLNTSDHIYHPGRVRGGRVVDTPAPLYAAFEDIGGAAITMGAGFEPVARRLLEGAGYGFKSKTVRRRLPDADLDAVGRVGAVDRPLLDLVAGGDRGLVRYDPREVDVAWLVAQVALAYPEGRIAVVTARVGDVVRVARQVRAYVPEVGYISGEHTLAEVGRVVVATPTALGDKAAELWRRQVVLALEPLALLGRSAQVALRHATRARLFGFLDVAARPAPRDRDGLVALYGLREAVVPRHGHELRRVAVAWTRVRGGAPLSPGLDAVALRRRGVWSHPVRNRRVVRAAFALERVGPGDGGGEFRALRERLEGVDVPRVAILAANLEHALHLHQTLPRWPLVVGPDADATGLGSWRTRVLAQRRWEASDPPDRAVVTLAGLGGVDLGDYDAVVRADGGGGVPDSLVAKMITARAGRRPLVLVDCDDRHHPELRRRSRSRRDAYDALGWAGDADPLDRAVDRFLAERPGAAS